MPEPAQIRNETDGLALLGLIFFKRSTTGCTLELHVVNMDFGDRTAIEEVLEHLVRRVRVNMHLIDRRIADAQFAIAHRLEEVERCVLVEIIRMDERNSLQ